MTSAEWIPSARASAQAASTAAKPSVSTADSTLTIWRSPSSEPCSAVAMRDPGPAATILTPDALRLRHLPIADCAGECGDGAHRDFRVVVDYLALRNTCCI